MVLLTFKCPFPNKVVTINNAQYNVKNGVIVLGTSPSGGLTNVIDVLGSLWDL